MKKRLLSALLALCILPVLMGAGISAENDLCVSAVINGVEINAVEANGETFLFLPPDADVNALSLRFEIGGAAADSVVLSGANGSVQASETINLNDLGGQDSQGYYVLSAEAGDVVDRIYIMQGEGLPTMYLTSANGEEDRAWVDTSKSNEAEGSMLLLDENGERIYDGALTQIKARGNSTFREYPKKAYQIKLENKTDLLGNGEKVKTWVLLANYGDATMIHDKFFKDLAAKLGMDYSIGCDWVNLYYDGEYRGVYLLSEKVSVGGDAVDITDMEELYEELNETYGDDLETAEGVNAYGQKVLYTVGLTEPEDITGGWLIEKNMDEVDEANGFYTLQEMAFNVKGPEFAGREAMEYISVYYQDFENAVFATDENGNYTGYNAETGKYYYEYCDLESLIQIFLIQELGLNPDGFNSSMFFYKDAGGMMYAGPIWDWDMSLGTGWTKYIPETVEDYHYLAKPLMQIPHFRKAMAEYYTNTFAPLVKRLLVEGGEIDQNIATLAPNAAMDKQLWPYVRVGKPSAEGHLWAEGTTYETVTDDMKRWLNARLAILDQRFTIEEDNGEVDVPSQGGEGESIAPDGLTFTDVNQNAFYYDALVWALENGITYGKTATTFAPDATCTRGEMVTFLYRAAGEPSVEGLTHPFTDVRADAFYYNAMLWAYAKGITVGSSDTTFSPDATCTRGQMAAFLYRANSEETSAEHPFTDVPADAYYADAVAWLYAEGITYGKTATTFVPDAGCNRAEMVTFLYRWHT